MSALADFRTRVLQVLLDTGASIWDNAAIDETLRYALDEYSLARPAEYETAFELPADGREIALSHIPGLLAVQDVWWPYDPTTEAWPPNRVRGFHIYWDDTRPVLFLDPLDGAQPQAGDQLRIWYTIAHTIENLDSATVTTLPSSHESLVVNGAAAHAAMSRALDLVETAGADLYAAGLIGSWAARKMREYKEQLQKLSTPHARAGKPFASGWKLDRWDRT